MSDDKNKIALSIRKAFIDDYDSIMLLQDDVICNMSNKKWFCPSTSQEIKTFLENPQDYFALVVAHGEMIVAFACLILNPSSCEDLYRDLKDNNIEVKTDKYCIFETVFVSPRYRGYSIQRTLINELCDLAFKNGKRSICATVHPDNIYSMKNFEKSGFERVNSEPLPKYGGIRNYFVKDLM